MNMLHRPEIHEITTNSKFGCVIFCGQDYGEVNGVPCSMAWIVSMNKPCYSKFFKKEVNKIPTKTFYIPYEKRKKLNVKILEDSDDDGTVSDK